MALDWSSDGELLVADTGPTTGTIEIWDIDTGEPHPTLDDAITDADHAQFVPGERTLAVERDGVIEFVDVDSGTVEKTLMPPAGGTLFDVLAGRSFARLPRQATADSSTCSASTRTPFP